MHVPHPVQPASFLTRTPDPKDPRLAELATPATGENSGGVAIIGYADDEGIKLNGGRPGAALGPTEIRRWLYRMTPHPRKKIKAFLDLGDWRTDTDVEVNLEKRHEYAAGLVAKHLQKGQQILTFGGGNDYSYPDGRGFLEQSHNIKPLIINVDAHLDVRDLSRGLSSGTPFFRLLESGKPFDFVELGIQGQCNAKTHWQYVEDKGGKILSMDEYCDSGVSLTEFTLQRVGDWLLRPRPTYIAIDMDAFAWPFAMGTSAAWPLGLDPLQFNSLLQTLCARLDVRVLGIYETSPPLDHGGGTARLAAQFAHGFLHHV